MRTTYSANGLRRLIGSLALAVMVSAPGPVLAHEEYIPVHPPPAQPEGAVLAAVNGEPVTVRACREAYKHLPVRKRPSMTSQEVLDAAIKKELLVQEAIRRGYDRDVKLEAQQTQIRDSFAKTEFERQVFEKIESAITEDDLRRHYEANRDRFSRDGEVRPFDAVKGAVKRGLVEKRIKDRYRELYAEAEKDGLIDVKEDALDKLMAPPPYVPDFEMVLATVDGAPIEVHDFARVFAQFERPQREAVRRDPMIILDGLIHEEVRRRAGVKAELYENPALEQYLDRRKREYLLRAVYRDRSKREDILEPVSSIRPDKYKVTEDEVRAYYETHEERFTTPGVVVARYILLDSREAAEKVLAELEAGADFAALARERSRDPATRADGGRLPPATRGDLSPELEKAAFSLAEGATSGVVKDAAGYHVLQVMRHWPDKLAPFEAVDGRIRRELAAKKRIQETKAFVAELRRQAEIVIHEDKAHEMQDCIRQDQPGIATASKDGIRG